MHLTEQTQCCCLPRHAAPLEPEQRVCVGLRAALLPPSNLVQCDGEQVCIARRVPGLRGGQAVDVSADVRANNDHPRAQLVCATQQNV